MLKIVQVAAPTPAGGLERVVESLAVGHHRRGHDVTVVALLHSSEPEHPFVDGLEDRGVSVRTIRVEPSEYLRERREVAHLYDELRPDVVHLHGYRVDLLHRSPAARRRIPTVTTVHGASKMGGLKTTLLEWLQRMNYRRFDAVVAVSADLYEESRRDGVPDDRLHLIHNAWGGLVEPHTRETARKLLGIGVDEAVVGWVGRLIPVKGGDIFIEALGRLSEPRPTGVLIGYGPEAEGLAAQCTALGIADSVRFFPEIRDAARYFPAFDTYVLSSRSEGLPIVILEAMASGTPIVAARIGGVGEALAEEDAWLVPPEDPKALASAIEASLRDRARAEERAGRARQRLEREYSLDTFLDRHEVVYRALVGEGPT